MASPGLGPVNEVVGFRDPELGVDRARPPRGKSVLGDLLHVVVGAEMGFNLGTRFARSGLGSFIFHLFSQRSFKFSLKY
jgi:hypothetical protein